VEVTIVNEGDVPWTVQLVEVSDCGRFVRVEWDEHPLPAGRSVTEARYSGSDSMLRLSLVRDDGASRSYTLFQYVDGATRLEFHLRLTAQGLARAQVRKRSQKEFEDVRWELDEARGPGAQSENAR
jgi:hypothetical protein